ncbi:hypothetical protein [Pedobacter duraquae]|uniref:Uncharacterized protein n=1 Tax=Pedobacter duraquae TaxID=425511 RepID=A0A4R6IIQ4_9SPHI|nr:hypothetical protein [Pedobacter duraquae]TDO21869.1 hypothetical protein CLV32_2977 [Pedobacter duraquae]
MRKFTFSLKMGVIMPLFIVFTAFSAAGLLEEQSIYIQKKLLEHYDADQEILKIKKTELNVTNTGFCRYKRHFENGKVEYFSFNLIKFKDLDYVGTVKSGRLIIRTLGEDVIVQTYNDKKGDIDSMAAAVSIPLKQVEAEDLNDFAEKFQQMHQDLKK